MRAALLTLTLCMMPALAEPWPAEKAQQWYARQPWLLGANYLPANAINQLEMWQAGTWDPKTIDIELGWAQGIGMNTMRVFLHDLAWKRDPQGFLKRLDEFLAISARHGIRPMLVFFDSCWDPHPAPGPQRAPRPGIHNSGWVQSPGAKLLASDAAIPGLERYVRDVVKRFARDPRVLAWDVWNEPDNPNTSSYKASELPNKEERVAKLLPLVFAWVRQEKPTQPVTSGVWVGPWGRQSLAPIHRIQIEESDVITFHNYEEPARFEARILELAPYGRPLICTEYLARNAGNKFENILPIARKNNVGMINWGLVAGRSQTNLPWDSWQKPYVGREPEVWQHDIFHADGRPYIAGEPGFLRKTANR